MKTLELSIDRVALKETYTIGRLYVDGLSLCDTLEDRVRELPEYEAGPFYKIAGETAIPRGRYKVIVNYSPKFKRNLPLLINVPYFTGIRIHRGTRNEHTAGCILVGENKTVGEVINSAYWEEYITKLIYNFDGDCYITIE